MKGRSRYIRDSYTKWKRRNEKAQQENRRFKRDRQDRAKEKKKIVHCNIERKEHEERKKET